MKIRLVDPSCSLRTDMKKLIFGLCNFANAPKIVLKEIFNNSVRALWNLEYVGPVSYTAWGISCLEPPLLNRGNQNSMKYEPPSYAPMKVNCLTQSLVFTPSQHPV